MEEDGAMGGGPDKSLGTQARAEKGKMVGVEQRGDWDGDDTTDVDHHGPGPRSEAAMVMELSETPLAMVDNDGTLLELNERFASFLNVRRRDARGKALPLVLSSRGLAVPIEEILAGEPPAIAERIPFSSILDAESAPRLLQVFRGTMVRLPAGRWLVAFDRSLDELSLLRRRAQAVSHISHNMRSSLTAVRGFAELLLSQDFSREETLEFLGHIHHEGLVMQQMVDALATYVYYQSGRALNWPIKTCSVGELVASALREVQTKGSDVNVEIDLKESDSTIVGNLEHLSFGLSQVIDNAIVFGGREGRPRIIGSPRGDWYEIRVQDQGPGMSPKDIRRAFEPFYSGTPAQKESRPRMGLGLTVARYTVEVHGGHIRLESHPGQGTVVIVSLPNSTGLLP